MPSSTGKPTYEPRPLAANSLIRDQIRENAIVKQYYCDVDIAHLISYNEELAHKLTTQPADIIPLVRRFSIIDLLEGLTVYSSRQPSKSAHAELSFPHKKLATSPYPSTNFYYTPPSLKFLSVISTRPIYPTSSAYLGSLLVPLHSPRKLQHFIYNAEIASTRRHCL